MLHLSVALAPAAADVERLPAVAVRLRNVARDPFEIAHAVDLLPSSPRSHSPVSISGRRGAALSVIRRSPVDVRGVLDSGRDWRARFDRFNVRCSSSHQWRFVTAFTSPTETRQLSPTIALSYSPPSHVGRCS